MIFPNFSLLAFSVDKGLSSGRDSKNFAFSLLFFSLLRSLFFRFLSLFLAFFSSSGCDSRVPSDKAGGGCDFRGTSDEACESSECNEPNSEAGRGDANDVEAIGNGTNTSGSSTFTD